MSTQGSERAVGDSTEMIAVAACGVDHVVGVGSVDGLTQRTSMLTAGSPSMLTKTSGLVKS